MIHYYVPICIYVLNSLSWLQLGPLLGLLDLHGVLEFLGVMHFR